MSKPNTKYKLCDKVTLLALANTIGREFDTETHIIANLNMIGNTSGKIDKERYLVSGYGIPVYDYELTLIEKFIE